VDDLDLAIVDVETTGVSPSSDRIIEVAVIRVSGGKVVEEFSSLVDPERQISPRIWSLTGITDEDLRDAPLFRQIKDDLLRLLDGSILVAHNARFDYAFLRREFGREKIAYTSRCLCTARLSRMLFPQFRSHSLDAIIERFSLGCAHRHRALDDAKVLWDFMGCMKATMEESRLIESIGALLKGPAFPALLDESSIRSLPRAPGVYIFYGARGEALYAGTAGNIRESVQSMFVDNRHGPKKAALRGRVADVGSEETPGVLGALLRQSLLIKELSPPFNARPGARTGSKGRKDWPFPGAIAIDEKNEASREGEVFIVDNWDLVAWLAYDDYGTRRVRTKANPSDHDVYPIFVRYLQGRRAARARLITREELGRMLDSLDGEADVPNGEAPRAKARVSGEAPQALPVEGVLNQRHPSIAR